MSGICSRRCCTNVLFPRAAGGCGPEAGPCPWERRWQQTCTPQPTGRDSQHISRIRCPHQKPTQLQLPKITLRGVKLSHSCARTSTAPTLEARGPGDSPAQLLWNVVDGRARVWLWMALMQEALCIHRRHNHAASPDLQEPQQDGRRSSTTSVASLSPSEPYGW